MNAEPTEILLVEDNPDDVELTLRALRAEGEQRGRPVERLRDARDLREIGRPETPDEADHLPPDGYPRLVLLDLKLPRVGGLEVLKKLKESPRTRTIPVVVLTSSREESDLVQSYDLGANSYIVKPVDFDQFVHAVSELGLYWLLLNKVPR